MKIAYLLSSESSCKKFGLGPRDPVDPASSADKKGKRKSFFKDLFKLKRYPPARATGQQHNYRPTSLCLRRRTPTLGDTEMWEVRNATKVRPFVAEIKKSDDFFEKLLVRDAEGYTWTERDVATLFLSQHEPKARALDIPNSSFEALIYILYNPSLP